MDAPSDTDKSNEPNDPDEGSRSGTALDKLKELIPAQPELHVTEDHILSVISVRRARDELFGPGLFSDPAWDIILELYAAKLGNRVISLGDLARAIDLPASVLTRWINVLAMSGVVLVGSEVEPSSALVELTDVGGKKFGQLVHRWGSAFRTI